MNLPLYKYVYNDLKKSIQDSLYPVGAKLPTDSELTEKYGVSNITIKKAMDLLKEEQLVSRKPRKGTYVINTDKEKNSSEPLNKTINIGVILTDFNEYFGNNMLKSMLKQQPERVNCIIKISNGESKREEKLITQLIDDGVDGIILIPSSSQYFSSKLMELISSNYPLVLVDRMIHRIPTCNVTIDNKSAASDSIEYLFSKGHSKIGIITACRKLSTNNDRIEGAISAHIQNNTLLNQSQILDNMKSMTPNSKIKPDEDVKKIKSFILENPNISAIFAGEYAIALLVKQAINELGYKVGKDFSVVCFDHAPIDLFKKNQFVFDHISQDENKIGEAAVSLIIEKLNNPNLIKTIKVKHQLISGESVTSK